MIPNDLKYTKEHEWVKVEGDTATVGVTDHAQSELGDITFVDLPAAGKELKKTDSLATIESVKAASDVYSPVSGKVSEVNETLNSEPEKINRSPYGDGWICKLSVADKAELDSLMDAAAYGKYLEETH
jgi:glycine cleavage system H protein